MQPQQKRSPSATALITALLVIAAAWVPTIRPYVPVCDDFTIAAQMDHGLADYLPRYVRGADGIQRLFQQPMVAWLTRPNPYLFPAVAVLLHLLTAALFFGCCRRLSRSDRVSMLATVLCFAFPWGFQAVLWASGFGNVIAALVFFGCLYLLLITRRRYRPVTAAVVGLLTLAANLTQENLTFSFAVVGLIVLVPRRKTTLTEAAGTALRRVRRRYDAWAPAIAAAVYVVTFLALRDAHPSKKLELHLPTLAAVFARQYANLFVFQVWKSRVCLTEAWNTRGPLWVVAGGIAATGIGFAIAAFHRTRPRPARPVPVWRVAALAVVLLAAAGIFVLAGGWSNESRKKYEIVPLIVLPVAVLVSNRIRRGPAFAGVIAMTIVAIPTTWVVAGVYDTEALRTWRLTRSLIENAPDGPVAIRWTPDIYTAWPKFQLLLGMRLDMGWTIEEATHGTLAEPVEVVEPGEPVPLGAAVFTVTDRAVILPAGLDGGKTAKPRRRAFTHKGDDQPDAD